MRLIDPAPLRAASVRPGATPRVPLSLRAPLAAALAGLTLLGCAESSVVRGFHGREVKGRFISAWAYALYARASDGEARGELEDALVAYNAAAVEDAGSAEIWTRIGAVRCQLKGRRGAPEEAFDLAETYDVDYEPLWRERAKCALAEGRFAAAFTSAEHAVALNPESVETSALHAVALEKLSRTDEARRELVALTIRHPTSTEAWSALADHATRTGAPAIAEHAARRVRDLAPRRADRAAPHPLALGQLAEIDAALTQGDLAEARRRAKSAHVLAADVAVRAAALGQPRIAREQAALVLGADPTDSNARIALAVAADLLCDASGLDQALGGVPDVLPVAPSGLARVIFAELLDRRVGEEAARAWLGPAPLTGADDPLLQRVSERLRAQLATKGPQPE